MNIQASDKLKAAVFCVMFVGVAILVGLDKVSPDVLKTFMLILAPSPVFSFEKKEGGP
jgi:hypothetical protein